MGSSETPARQEHPVRVARKAAGLTLKDLGQRARISTSYVSMIEKGLLPPEPVQRRIAAALGKRVAELW